MRLSLKGVLVSLVAVAALLMPLTAGAQTVGDAVSTFTYTKNMNPLGYSPRVVPPTGADRGSTTPTSRSGERPPTKGATAGSGSSTSPNRTNPVELNNYKECSAGTTNGNQGDVIVWEDLLVRSWNSPATGTSSAMASRRGRIEGLHIFDISDPSDPTRWARGDGRPAEPRHDRQLLGRGRQLRGGGRGVRPGPDGRRNRRHRRPLQRRRPLADRRLRATGRLPRRCDRGRRPRHLRLRAEGGQRTARGRERVIVANNVAGIPGRWVAAF